MTGEAQGVKEPTTLSIDSLVIALLATTTIAFRYVLPLPQLIPYDAAAAAILILLLGILLGLDLNPGRRRSALISGLRSAIVWVAILITTLAPWALAIGLRAVTEPSLYVHDGLIQSEEATRAVLGGQNPYAISYRETAMADYPFRVEGLTENPALDHYPYLPMTFLLPLPLQAVFDALGMRLDHRLVYGALLILAALLASRLARDPARKRAIVAVLAMNPVFVPYFVEGRNDVLVLFWIVLFLVLGKSGRWTLAAVALGFASTTKPFAWVLLPLAAFLIHQDPRPRAQWRGPILAFSLTVLLVIGPWLVASPGAFVEDALLFQSGSLPGAYPISGLGFSALALRLGLVSDALAPYPAFLLQAILGGGLLVLLMRRLRTRMDLPTLLGSYAIVLLTVLYFSRAFQDNYIGFILQAWALAVLVDRVPLPGPMAERSE